MWPPAPPPEAVRSARAYLTPRYAVGVDLVLWEMMARLLPDRTVIDAVIAASARAQQAAGDDVEAMDVAAALVVLEAARLNVDQSEARLLKAAQASGLGWEQIAGILDLSVGDTEERYRRLIERLDEPSADEPPACPRQGPSPGHQNAGLAEGDERPVRERPDGYEWPE